MTIGRAFSPFDAVLDRMPRIGVTLRSGVVTATGPRITVDLAGGTVTDVPYVGGEPVVGNRIWLLRQGSTLLGLSSLGGGGGNGGGGAYLPLTGGTLTGALLLPTIGGSAGADLALTSDLAMAGFTVTGLPLPVDPDEAANREYVDTGDAALADDINLLATQVSNEFLRLSGGTMTGTLTLANDPTNPLEAVTLQYLDTSLADLLTQVSTLYLPLSGGVLTGPLTLPADPTNDLEAATKQYVDASLSFGAAPHVVDPVEPLDPADGLLWTNPDEIIPSAPWIGFTPVLTSDGGTPTIGNGTLIGRYMDGPTVRYQVKMTLGSTTDFGTGNLYISLPTPARPGEPQTSMFIGMGMVYDLSVGQFCSCHVQIKNDEDRTQFLMVNETIGAARILYGGAPMVWGVGDGLTYSASYERAF